MTTAKTEPRTDQVQMIAIEDLRVAEWNARKTIDLETLKSFTESIQQHGIQVPLIVRPFAKGYFVKNGLSQVRYVCHKNPVGHDNIIETFNAGTAEENQRNAEKWAAEKNGPGDFEIVAGHRRFKAASLLKLAELPCMVRKLDDVQAREIGLVDNLQREDVPALEEADAYKELLSGTVSPASIAARVGKDVAYITKRLQLVSLGELQRKALAERLITIDHALLLARLGQDEQDANLKWALDRNAGVKKPVEEVIAEAIKDRDRKTGGYGSYWEPQSVKELKAHIEQGVGRKLNRAPWDLDDAKLVPEVGACSSCPSNTKANVLLFDDLSIQAATCADGHCFERKRAAFVQIRLNTIPKQKVDPSRFVHQLRVSHKSTTVESRADRAGVPEPDRDGLNPNQVFKYGQWIDAKKSSCEFVRQAVTVDWDEPSYGSSEKLKKPGQVIDVCIAAKCKVHRKAYQKQATGNGGNNAHSEAARRAAEEKAKQERIAESKLRIAIASQALEGVTKLPLEAIRAAALHELPSWDEALRPLNAMLPGIQKILKESKADSPEFVKAVALAFLPERTLNPEHYWINREGRDEFLVAMKRLGWKGPDPWAKPEKPKTEKAAAVPARKAAKPAAKKAVKKAAAKKGRAK